MVALADWLFWRRRMAVLSVVAALVAVVVATTVGYYLRPGQNYFAILGFLIQAHDFSALVSMGLGVGAALIWGVRFLAAPDGDSQVNGLLFSNPLTVQLLQAASIVGVVACSLAFIWKDVRGVQRDPAARVHSNEYVIEKVADLDYPPIRVAVGDGGKVYVCYDYFEDAGTIGGGIVELTQDQATGVYHKRVVADSPLLMRCYGLIAQDGELFVSRSGIFGKATGGSIHYEDTGAVTRLRDMDGDGYFEYVEDIVTGLPGAKGPDTMQQNNGICFGDDGSLWITTASAANRTLTGHPWEGAVLRVPRKPGASAGDPDEFGQPEVFARGFRNPFGIVVGPDQQIFVSDNDVDENPGDELNHVVRGAHYGHPFVVPNEPVTSSEGFRDPIFLGEHEWNFLGMVYATTTSLPPADRDHLYVVDFMQHGIWKMRLEKSGETYRVLSVDRFASISSPVDIALNDSGEFFVVSRFTRNLYRIRPRQTAREVTHD